jgi:hypothetical protein
MPFDRKAAKQRAVELAAKGMFIGAQFSRFCPSDY